MLRALVTVLFAAVITGCSTAPNLSFRYLEPYSTGGLHTGIDIDGYVGEPVRAPRAGRVIWAQPNDGSIGARITLAHDQGLQTQYYHIADPLVHTGASVQQGQIIARLALTGTSGPYNPRTITRPHLHLEAARDGLKIDPETLKMSCEPTAQWRWPVGCR